MSTLTKACELQLHNRCFKDWCECDCHPRPEPPHRPWWQRLIGGRR